MSFQSKSYRHFLATSMTAALIATAAAPATGLAATEFSDVKEGTAYYGPITELAKAGVVNGYNDGTFKIRGKVKRAEAAQIIAAIRGLDLNASKAPFTDVKQDAWYAKAVNAAFEAGAISGENGKFKPDGKLTRAEFAQMVMAAYDIEPVKNAVHPFTDVKKDAWYESAIATLSSLDLISGKSNTTFAPSEHIDRGDLVLLIYKVDQKYGKNQAETPTTPPKKEEEVKSVKALNTTTVEITYKDEVGAIKASDFSIEGLDIKQVTMKQDDDKTVVLTTSKQEGNKTYRVKKAGMEIGTFTGYSAVVPDKLEVANTTQQGIVGKQVTVKADVKMKTAGIPVTFQINAGDHANKSEEIQVLTNADGIAELNYTQYNPGVDDIAVYPTDDPSKRGFAKVFWGMKDILKITAEDNKGTSLNNNESKFYKVTYLDPRTGNPLANETLHITLAENIDVTIDKASRALVNGDTPMQLTNGSVKTMKVMTNMRGEATFTLSGVETKATPIVFVDTAPANNMLDAGDLQHKAETVTFGAAQGAYQISVTRDGSEYAAIGMDGGRKYKVVVKDKNGKAASGARVNIAFNENMDNNPSTNTNAFFIENGIRKEKELTIQLDKNGEGSFIVGSLLENDYATPFLWIDIDSPNSRRGVYDKGEPSKLADIVYFGKGILDNASLNVYRNGYQLKKDEKVNTSDSVTFKFEALNQSGNTLSSHPSLRVTFTVYNAGGEELTVRIGNLSEKTLRPYESYTETIETNRGPGQVYVTPRYNGTTTKVRVEANATTIPATSNELANYLGSHISELTFLSARDIDDTIYTGYVSNIDENKREITFSGKDPISYDGASFFAGGGEISPRSFIDEVNKNKNSYQVTYKKDGDKVTFNIVYPYR